jgi:diaminohydroxyphosphoribosylaminopyrimidine deaminase/5-amino-6-(5-phosphoribosylamino)uracil reductase
VGAIIVKDGMVIARGWTQAGGRPHAEAVALTAAGPLAAGATLYVSLEPCAHASERGPSCCSLIIDSGLARIIAGCPDPDPRTAGKGIESLRAAGLSAELLPSTSCKASLAGYLTRARLGRPHVTLKLAMSADGALGRPPGESQWITSEASRAHVHAMRAKMDAILVGSGTFQADSPRLDVRLPGLESRSPQRWVLTSGAAPEGWQALASPQIIGQIKGAQYLMVEGGVQTARAFLDAGLVDRLMIYRAPLTIAADVPRLAELTPAAIAHSGKWQRTDRRTLGNDTLDVYELLPCSPE